MTHTDTQPTETAEADQPTNTLAAWLWPGEWREALARWVITAIVTAIATTALVIHPWLRWTLGAAVALALALAAVRRRSEQHEDQEPQDETDDEPRTPGPAEIADIVNELGERTGVLLTRIRDQLLEEYDGRSWTTKDVRVLLAEAGIRVREGVRVTGVGNGPGVHREDVPPPLSPTPLPTPVGVVGPGQDANTNTNNVNVQHHAGGAHITVTPARHHVHHERA